MEVNSEFFQQMLELGINYICWAGAIGGVWGICAGLILNLTDTIYNAVTGKGFRW